MNFEVLCFGWVHDNRYNCESLAVVQKEYFETYDEAAKFQDSEWNKYEGIDITPMNEKAYEMMP